MDNRDEKLLAALDDAISKITALLQTAENIRLDIDANRRQPPKWTNDGYPVVELRKGRRS